VISQPSWRLLIRIFWTVYGVLFAVLATAATHDDLKRGYPSYFIWPAAFSYLAVTSGIWLHAFDSRSDRLALLWRRVFPVLLALLAIGLVMDAILPADYSLLTDGRAWLLDALRMAVIIAPAYYANYRLAYGPSNPQFGAGS
jgi:hypothetical protein